MKENTVSVPPEIPAAAIRLRAATTTDVDAVFTLISESSRSTTVLPRTRDSISEHVRDFVVAEQDGVIIGCGALAVCTRYLAEIRSLVVAASLRGRGVGGQLVLALVEEARRLGVRRIFALTDNVPFFQRLGFVPVDKATLPHKVWNDCIRCPKFLNCTEEAVDLILTPVVDPGASAGGPGAA